MLIFLYGEDDYRSRQKLIELKAKFIREVDPNENSFFVFDGARTNLRELNDKLSTSSLFTRKKMIVVENIFSTTDLKLFPELIELLSKEKNEDDNIIIFWDSDLELRKNKIILTSRSKESEISATAKKMFEFLRKQKFAQHFAKLTNFETQNWIKNETAKHGKTITLKSAQTLIALLGNDLWRLKNELDKIMSYMDSQALTETAIAKIEETAIKELIKGKVDENIFALTDAISTKNKTMAMRLLEDQYTLGAGDLYILSMFVRQFKILIQIKQAVESGLSSKGIASQLNLHSFVLQKGMNQVRNFTMDKLRSILNELLEIDRRSKTGLGNIRTDLEMLIARL